MTRPVSEMAGALVEGRGAIVSSADCSVAEVAAAQACRRFFVDADGLGFVLRPKEWRERAERIVAAPRDPATAAPATGDPLRGAAERLLAAAMDYWKVFQKTNPPGGAVVWVEDDDGRLVILTRGEYREQLMENVHTLGTKTRAFDA